MSNTTVPASNASNTTMINSTSPSPFLLNSTAPSPISSSPSPVPLNSTVPSSIPRSPSSIYSPSPFIDVDKSMQQFIIILLLITGMCFFLGFKNRKILRKVGRTSYFNLMENNDALEMNVFDNENPSENSEEQQIDTGIKYKDNPDDNVTNK